MLHIVTWLWGSKYGPEYVDRLRAGVARHLKSPYRFHVVAVGESDLHLTKIKGCFARLRMFDPYWQFCNGMEVGDRIVCMDLDSIVTGDLDPLFTVASRFMILRGANAANPCPFNGSIFLLRCGHHQDVWSEFSLEAASRTPHYEFPDDQGWLWHKIPNAAGWEVGPRSGIYAFQKPGWPKGDALPKDARLVVFPGWRDPSRFAHLLWVKEHWLA